MIRIVLFVVLAFSSFYSFGQVQPSVTISPTSQNACFGSTAYITATAQGNNTITYFWQYWTGVTYANLANNSTYSGVNLPSLAINTTTLTGVTYYRCRIRDGSSTIDYFSPSFSTLNLVPPPPTPTITNGFTCGPGTVTLGAAGATGTQTYQWYYLNKPINGEVNATFTTPSISTNTTYTVTIDNGTCESVQVPALAQVFTAPAAPGVTNGSLCGPGAVILNATGAANGQYRWYAPSAKPPIAGQINSSYTTPSIPATATYNVSIFNGTCESSRVAIVAQINTVPTAPTTTGNSSCGPASLLLTAAGGTIGQYRWYTTATGGTAITGQTNSTYTTPSLSASTIYYVAINNGLCESVRASIQAQIIPIPTAPVTTGASTCTSAALTLNASGASNGQYRWYTSASTTTPIAGQTNGSYTTPVLSSSVTYYVTIDTGVCESARKAVTAAINIPPAAPGVTNNSLCAPGRVSLAATGAIDGQYRWYTTSTGGQPLTAEVNSKFLTTSITATTIFYAAINNGTCESTRTPVTATIGGVSCNNAPVIQSIPINTQIEGKVTLDLVKLISDADKNLDLNTLKIITPPKSGASASITPAYALILDYETIIFSGLENLTIEVCDKAGACTQKQLNIEVAGDIVVYNAISPGNDSKNDIFMIKYIDILSAKNHVSIYSRWGDLLFDISDYDNLNKVFRGLNNSGNEIPSGTYFYKIELSGGKAPRTGYVTLKR